MTKLVNRPLLLLALGIVALIMSAASACGGTATTPPPTETIPALTVVPAPRMDRLDTDFWASAELEDVRAMLNLDVDINTTDDSGATALHLAVAHNDDPAVVGLLLDRGGDVEARDEIGWTPLHWAARLSAYYDIFNEGRSSAIIESLLYHGADIEARNDYGRTPLHVVAEHGTYSVAELLLDHGADIEARDDDGWTPWHIAAARGENPSVIRLILDGGADIEARTDADSTPLHVAAANNNNPLVIAELLDHGADIEAIDSKDLTPPGGGGEMEYESDSYCVVAGPWSRLQYKEWFRPDTSTLGRI